MVPHKSVGELGVEPARDPTFYALTVLPRGQYRGRFPARTLVATIRPRLGNPLGYGA